MSKYDFELDLTENTSTGKILNRIKKGSTVLEFGCATGRMTRYMKQELDCRVYIVEYDQGAFEQALQYAEDGVCDDIMRFRWTERFAGLTFDAIIFADVLEHLPQPEQVLKAAADLLKEDGTVLVSVPNVTHNDVILKAIEEQFDYTETGLLDNTHIHFWGLENIRILGREAGLTVRNLEGTYCPMGGTEQNVQTGKNLLLENMLQQRRAGEVYQFVLALDKRGGEEQDFGIEVPGIRSHVYLDTGKDFNAEERMAVQAVYTERGTYAVHVQITDVQGLCQVRLDPIEQQGVILQRISIQQQGEELPVIAPNGIQLKDGLYLPGEDPMVFAQVEAANGTVTVDAEFVIPGPEYLRAAEAAICAKQAQLEEEEARHRQEMQSMQERLYGEIEVLRNSVDSLHDLIGEQNRAIEAKDMLIHLKEEQCGQLQADVNAYISLVNQKEKYILNIEGELHKLQASPIYRLLVRYNGLCTFAGRVLRKLKYCIKKILGRVS